MSQLRWGARVHKARGVRIVAVFGMLALAACGTRVPHDEALAIATGSRGASAPGRTSTLAAASTPSAGADSPGGAGTDVSGNGPATAAGADATATTGPGGSATRTAGATSAADSGSATKAPIVVGMEGVFSGIAGANTAPARDAYAAWVKMVNAKGGINGHPVKLYVGDDGADTSKSMAIIRDFVENRHVIALVNLFPPANDAAVAKYAESKHIPIVGGWGIDPMWNQSPVMFPAAAGADAGAFAWAKALADNGAKKVGAVYCSEGAVCKVREQAWARYAKGLGLDVVYEAGVSLAQPDYTSECLAARGAGADGMLVETDGNSVMRFARSCWRQGFKPTIVNPAPTESTIPELEGSVAAIPTFPWFLSSGSPAVEEYAAAMAKYARGVPTGYEATTGWTSGKLLEKALANVGDTPPARTSSTGSGPCTTRTCGGSCPR